MTHRRAALAALAALALTVAVPLAGAAPASGRALAAAPSLAADDAAFGVDLLRTACAAAPAANQVLSPLSTSEALDLLAAGAKGTSAAALAKVLHQPVYGPALQRSLAARTAALSGLGGTNGQPTLQVSNHAYTQRGLAVRPGWLTAIRTAQRASSQQLDFAHAPEAARGTINAAVKKDTGGNIPTLLPSGSIDDTTRLVLTDALHLQARWAHAFGDPTAPQAFTTASGKTAKVPYLAAKGTYSYARDGGWQSVTLPFAAGDLQAVAILPPAGAGVCAIPDAARLARLNAHPADATVDLAVPTLKLDVRTPMGTVLKELGLQALFTAANLSGIAGKPGDLAVSDVLHEATLALDKTGVEASAATAVTIVATSAEEPPKLHETVHLNRPWVLELRDAGTGEPLFLARIADPSKH